MTHDRYDDDDLRDIRAAVRTVALVGASPNPARASNRVMRFLIGQGCRVIPVNPMAAGRKIHGEPCRAGLHEVAEPVDMVDIFRRSEAAGETVNAALTLSPLPRVIWMQLGVRDEAAAARAEAAGVKVVMDRCPAIEWPRLDRLPR